MNKFFIKETKKYRFFLRYAYIFAEIKALPLNLQTSKHKLYLPYSPTKSKLFIFI